MTVANAVDRFYIALHLLQSKHQGGLKLSFAGSANPLTFSKVPKNGVYFFFENGELRKASADQRVVRVGTHGLRANNSRLLTRISSHYSGNIRESAFRKLIAEALLKKLLPKKTIPLLEPSISQHLFCHMSFLLLPVSNPALRQEIEKLSIGLLSNCRSPIDPPWNGWLGLQHPDPRVQLSGLRNLDHVDLLCLKVHMGGLPGRHYDSPRPVQNSFPPKGIDADPDTHYDFLDDFISELEKQVNQCPQIG